MPVRIRREAYDQALQAAQAALTNKRLVKSKSTKL